MYVVNAPLAVLGDEGVAHVSQVGSIAVLGSFDVEGCGDDGPPRFYDPDVDPVDPDSLPLLAVAYDVGVERSWYLVSCLSGFEIGADKRKQ